MVQRSVSGKMPEKKEKSMSEKLITFTIDVTRAALDLRQWQSSQVPNKRFIFFMARFRTVGSV